MLTSVNKIIEQAAAVDVHLDEDILYASLNNGHEVSLLFNKKVAHSIRRKI